VRAVAVGLFSAGFALEVVADWQLGEFKEKVESKGKMCREGVWGVVRHPK
jgi:steroid 5-alpha reductase family enzyme